MVIPWLHLRVETKSVNSAPEHARVHMVKPNAGSVIVVMRKDATTGSPTGEMLVVANPTQSELAKMAMELNQHMDMRQFKQTPEVDKNARNFAAQVEPAFWMNLCGSYPWTHAAIFPRTALGTYEASVLQAPTKIARADSGAIPEFTSHDTALAVGVVVGSALLFPALQYGGIKAVEKLLVAVEIQHELRLGSLEAVAAPLHCVS